MKFAFLVGDGMGDYPLPELGGMTPLEASETPNMDRIASCRIGCVNTIPDGMDPGSDVANLSLLGYDPHKYHTGRSPFEAASMGIDLSRGEVAFRMNLVTLEFCGQNHIVMVSHSAGDITTDEGSELVDALADSITSPDIRIFPGIAYRHLLIWRQGPLGAKTLPPHDFLGRDVAFYLIPDRSSPVPCIVRKSWAPLKEHPINHRRRALGLKEANSVWLWGQGMAPDLPRFTDIYGVSGGVISAVDLIRGIGAYAGLEPIHVEGATGYLNTNYVGKGNAAVDALRRLDFVFVHVEAPDEASHSGLVSEKIKAIESFDRYVVGTVIERMADIDDFKVMVATDHFTPISTRTHSTESPPFAWATAGELRKAPNHRKFNEKNAAGSGLFFRNGHEMIKAFMDI
jgi:2,3-bisphosphoglycerate-independent phosphoglycerate mutase